MNILTRLHNAFKNLEAEGDTKELAKLGQLRAGSAGVELASGDLIGKCPRVALLRKLGVSEEIDTSSLTMFSGGYANEAEVERLLRTTLAPGEELTAGEDTSFSLPSGLKILGRPDLLIKEGGRPVEGVELKNVSSLWTARDVNYDLRPKSDHLIQAGLYSLMLAEGGVPLPYTLLYSSFAQFHLSTAPGWLKGKFKPGAPDVEFKLDKRSGREEPFKILSFFRAYDLTWEEGHLCYQTKGLDRPVRTEVSLESLDRWYQTVVKQEQLKQLAARPAAKSVDGTSSYKACDYCSFADVCDKSENNYELWLDGVLALPTTRRIV